MDSTTPQMVASLLLADSEPASRASLQAALTKASWEVLLGSTGEAARQILEARSVDVAVLDMRLADLNGVSLIEQARLLRPGLPVIAIAAEPTLDLAVAAMRAGAVDFLAKPFTYKSLQAKLAEWVPLPSAGEAEVVRLGGCLSVEPAVRTVLVEASRLAESDLPVAICGAPGTGRKYLAAAMHQASLRGGPIQVIDASLLSVDQMGARLAQAIDAVTPRGAIVVADIPPKPSEQEPLCRVLATNRSTLPRIYVTLSDVPARLVAGRQLAKPLAVCMASAVLALPPLAVRRADIPLLAGQIIAEVMLPKSPPALSPAVRQALVQYDWPGNIRQLRLVLERAARLAGGSPIELRHLPILQAVHRDPVPVGWTSPAPINLQEIVDNVERALIESALCRTSQNQAKAAELLGVPRTTLRDKLEKYGFTPRGRANGADE